MFKKLLKWVSLVVVIGLITKASMTYLAYRFIENMQQSQIEDIAFTYNWIDVSLLGQVELSEVTFTPFWLKQSFQVEKVSFKYDSVLASIEAFVSGNHGRVPTPSEFKMQGLATQLEDQKSWWPTHLKSFDIVTALTQMHACRNHSLLSLKSSSRMGISKVNANIGFSFKPGSTTSPKQMKGQIDLDPLGIFAFEFKTDETSDERDFIPHVEQWPLSGLSLKYNETGFMRRLSNFCGDMTGTDRTMFATNAASDWLVALKKQGIAVNAELALSYADFIASGGLVEVSAYPKKPISLSDLKSTFDENYFDILNAELRINKSVVGDAAVIAESAVFGSAPAPIIDDAPKQETALENAPQNLLYTWEQLENYLGKNLKITSLDGKVNEGKVISFDDKSLNIEQNLAGGKFGFNIKRETIASIYPKTI